jgi:hypothetical protein
MEIVDLLRHTSGLSYSFLQSHPVDDIYANNGFPPLARETRNLEEHVTEPIGMTETAFWARPHQHDRLAANYMATPDGGLLLIDDPETSPFREPPQFEGGGGGMVGTLDDYLRFCQCLLNGGELDGERVIGRKTLQYATRNHLPDNKTVGEMWLAPTFSEAQMTGMGFGLGFSVVIDAVPAAPRATKRSFSGAHLTVGSRKTGAGSLLAGRLRGVRLPLTQLLFAFRPQLSEFSFIAGPGLHEERERQCSKHPDDGSHKRATPQARPIHIENTFPRVSGIAVADDDAERQQIRGREQQRDHERAGSSPPGAAESPSGPERDQGKDGEHRSENHPEKRSERQPPVDQVAQSLRPPSRHHRRTDVPTADEHDQADDADDRPALQLTESVGRWLCRRRHFVHGISLPKVGRHFRRRAARRTSARSHLRCRLRHAFRQN